MSAADTPEPPPRVGTGDVWLEVVKACGARIPGFRRSEAWLAWWRLPQGHTTSEDFATAPDGLKRDMLARRAYGLRVHKMPLQRDNERKHWNDCYQESLDLIAYAWAANGPWWLRWGAVLFAWAIRRRLPKETR